MLFKNNSQKDKLIPIKSSLPNVPVNHIIIKAGKEKEIPAEAKAAAEAMGLEALEGYDPVEEGVKEAEEEVKEEKPKKKRSKKSKAGRKEVETKVLEE